MKVPDGFEALLDAAPDAMVVVDAEGRIAMANHQTEKVFGHPAGTLVGRPIESLMPERYRGRHVDHRDGYLADPRVRPMGARLDLYGLHRDGREFPVEISLSPIQLDGRAFVIAAIRDVSERKRVEADARGQLVAKKLVRRIIRDLSAQGGASQETRRVLGRGLATETGGDEPGAFIDAFHAMGIGNLRLEHYEQDRYTFSGDGLLEMTPGHATPTCHIALGFLEGVVAAIHKTPSLGAEVACQSQGHPRCVFIVKPKAR
jgi:PAS domain S-box-containing protein